MILSRVLGKIEELMIARKRVALIIETSLGSGREILRGITLFSRQHGNWELFHAARGLHEAVPAWIDSWECDGVIARLQTQEMAEDLKEIGRPVVDVLGVTDSPFPIVHVDDAKISQKVAGYFLEKGFSNFGFYGIENENWSSRRSEAFRNATAGGKSFSILEGRRADAEVDKSHYNDLRRWLKELPKPVAIMVCSDQMGLLLLEACRSEEISVPDQASVIGVDNDTTLCEVITPNLTSVRGGHFQVGMESARLLEDLMAGKAPKKRRIVVPPNQIVERESSDSRGIQDPAVRKAIEHIRTHFSEPVTNSMIAKEIGLSKTSLQVRFRKAVGQGVREFLTDFRLRKSISLIQTTDLTFDDIAGKTGFKHHEYLGYVLKKERGVTPGELRTTGSAAGPEIF